jgi:hypothetical protein
MIIFGIIPIFLIPLIPNKKRAAELKSINAEDILSV